MTAKHGFYAIEDLILLIEPPNRERCRAILEDNRERFSAAKGSSHNHQAWPGGYLDHVADVMNFALSLYDTMMRLAHRSTRELLPFKLSDALLVLFLHDIEKPWREEKRFASKVERGTFRWIKIDEYEIKLTAEQENAMAYVEGEGDDYSSDKRVMGELAAFCHMCDVASARVWHSTRLSQS